MSYASIEYPGGKLCTVERYDRLCRAGRTLRVEKRGNDGRLECAGARAPGGHCLSQSVFAFSAWPKLKSQTHGHSMVRMQTDRMPTRVYVIFRNSS
jgi:hypothetical protein